MDQSKSKLAGHRIQWSSKIQKQISDLVAAVAEEEKALGAIREPQSEAIDHGK